MYIYAREIPISLIKIEVTTGKNQKNICRSHLLMPIVDLSFAVLYTSHPPSDFLFFSIKAFCSVQREFI